MCIRDNIKSNQKLVKQTSSISNSFSNVCNGHIFKLVIVINSLVCGGYIFFYSIDLETMIMVIFSGNRCGPVQDT